MRGTRIARLIEEAVEVCPKGWVTKMWDEHMIANV
jgi:hypothetical protein